jgi:hypothetical protein
MAKRCALVVLVVLALPDHVLACGHRAKVSFARAYLFASELDGWGGSLNIPIPWCTDVPGSTTPQCDDESTSVVLSWTGVSGPHVRAGLSRDTDLDLFLAGGRLTPWSVKWHSTRKVLIPFVQVLGGLAKATENSPTRAEDWGGALAASGGFEIPVTHRLRFEVEGDLTWRWNFGETEYAPGLWIGASLVF